MAILIFLIDGRYIQRAAKVPIFEHFPLLHLSTFRCTSSNFEHFLCDNTVFCLHSRLTSCTFRVLSNTPRNIRFQKATKELEKHLPLNTSQYYKITQVATTCCTFLNFEHFLFRISTSRCSLSHILHF